MNLNAGTCFETGKSWTGHDIEKISNVNDTSKCEKLCQELSECKFWTLNSKTKICFLQSKNATNDKDICSDCIRGPKLCINTWKPIGDKIYQVITEWKSFDAAAKHCIQIKGKLFEPKTQKENNDVIKFFEPLKLYFWLGIHDKEKEGQFKYLSDNSAMVYGKWHTGEPNNANNGNNGEDCVVADGLAWNDVPCHGLNPFVCEKEQEGM